MCYKCFFVPIIKAILIKKEKISLNDFYNFFCKYNQNYQTQLVCKTSMIQKVVIKKMMSNRHGFFNVGKNISIYFFEVKTKMNANKCFI